jgi:N-acetylglutamate synthase-like GNAT family acetyltransferase
VTETLVDIRPALAEETQGIYALRQVLDNCVEVSSLEDSVVLVADNGSEIVGTAQLDMRPGEEHAELKHVAVHPESQGRRVGSQLVAGVEKIAKELGFEAVELETRKAETFYSGIGFRRLGAPIVGRTGNVVRMRKELVK